mmetsp:Transcript_9041/g.18482  ORF Transcript_9041/g.18482 Transcript_9041/m.18482 type:complete len:286 (+) Transcript_9041:109-966(+)
MRLMALPHALVPIAALGIEDGTTAVALAIEKLTRVDVAIRIGAILHQNPLASTVTYVIAAVHGTIVLYGLVIIVVTVIGIGATAGDDLAGNASDEQTEYVEQVWFFVVIRSDFPVLFAAAVVVVRRRSVPTIAHWLLLMRWTLIVVSAMRLRSGTVVSTYRGTTRRTRSGRVITVGRRSSLSRPGSDCAVHSDRSPDGSTGTKVGYRRRTRVAGGVVVGHRRRHVHCLLLLLLRPTIVADATSGRLAVPAAVLLLVIHCHRYITTSTSRPSLSSNLFCYYTYSCS